MNNETKQLNFKLINELNDIILKGFNEINTKIDLVNQTLHEGLMISVDREHMRRLLDNIGIKHESDEYEFEIEITKPLTDEEATNLRQILSVGGWYVAQPKDLSGDEWFVNKAYKEIGSTIISFSLEPKYDIVFPSSKLPERLYHAAPKRSRESIRTKGLVPKSRSQLAAHPDRLYFATTLNNAKDIKKMLEDIHTEDYDIWYVESSAVKGRKLYIDPNFMERADSSDNRWHGIYTVEPINRYKIYLLNIQHDEEK